MQCIISMSHHITKQNCSGAHKYILSDKYFSGQQSSSLLDSFIKHRSFFWLSMPLRYCSFRFLIQRQDEMTTAASTGWREHSTVQIRQYSQLAPLHGKWEELAYTGSVRCHEYTLLQYSYYGHYKCCKTCCWQSLLMLVTVVKSAWNSFTDDSFL